MDGQPKELDDIAVNIKKLRSQADWNQAALAKASGVSPATISLIEKGERLPSMIVMRKLASALQVSTDELTGRPSENAKERNTEVNSFFRKWQGIANLEDTDQKMITDIVNRLNEQKNDKG